MKDLVKSLISEIGKLPVIDSHEHLPCEDDIIQKKADVFTRIFCHYSITNAITAGMKIDRSVLMNTDIPLEERWEYFKPFRQAIENTGYARAGQITARDLYGIEEINDNTYIDLSEKLQAANKHGLYDNILKEKCGIERILNQGDWVGGKNDLALSVSIEFMELNTLSVNTLRDLYSKWINIAENEFKHPMDWLLFWLEKTAESYVGIKITASTPIAQVEDSHAVNIFQRFRNGTITDQDASILGTWFIHKAIEKAPEYRFVVAIHCGIMWDVNINFGAYHPMNIVPLLLRYPNTVFDLYHGGIPWVREMAVIGNQYPNANLNLVWCHQISPYMTEQMLNEWIDLVPINKIIGFGGDNCDGPEKTYGVLQMAYENIARTLAKRISRGQISEEQAIQISREWLYENPKRIYGLN